MQYLYLRVRRWLQAQDGQDLIEYSLLVALIGVVSAFGLFALGADVAAVWNTLSGWLGGVSPAFAIP